MTEDWAEIRRLHKSEQMSIKAIVRKTGLARNTVRAALASNTPPKYGRDPAGSMLDVYEPRIRELLAQFPSMPATVIAERIGWTNSSSVLRAKAAQLRPLYAPTDPADRTTYVAGEIVQCDLWFPGKVIPVDAPAASKTAGWVGGRPTADLPVLTMVAAFSGFIMATLLPTRKTGDLVAGMWQLLAGLGGVPKILVWDNEAGIGQHHRLTLGARSFAGTLGTRIYQTAARDPEAKGVVERANGFLETSFMPGREFESPGDYNTQLTGWLPRANARVLRRTGEQPGVRVAADVAAMGVLPPIAPSVGTTVRVRLGRDYYVRIAGNDYSVDPGVIGRFVDVHAGLDTVTITCAGTPVGAHQRCWSSHQTITDPVHVSTAAGLRTAFKARTADMRGPTTRQSSGVGAVVGVRALSDYDALFDLTPTVTDEAAVAARARLEVVR
nr:IS21 family transposase [Nocardioides gilvus]